MNSCEDEVIIAIEPSDPIQVVQLEPSEELSQMGSVDQDPSFAILVKEPDSAKTVCCDSGSSSGGVVDFAVESLSAQILKVQVTAGEIISATKLIYMIDETTCGLADKDVLSKKDAIGIALNAALPGNTVNILLFGRFADSFFGYPVNTSLYLGNNGNITDIAPLTGYSVLIGKGLGTGAVFIDIERPIIL